MESTRRTGEFYFIPFSKYYIKLFLFFSDYRWVSSTAKQFSEYRQGREMATHSQYTVAFFQCFENEADGTTNESSLWYFYE